MWSACLLCSTIDFEAPAFTAAAAIDRTVALDVDIGTTSASSSSFCSEMTGAQVANGPLQYTLGFSHEIAYFSAQIFDLGLAPAWPASCSVQL